MNQLIKEGFLSLFLKRRVILLVLFFVFWGVFFPGPNVYAAWYDFLIGAVTFIPMVAIALILTVATLLSSLLAAFSGVVLDWVLSPTFIDWSYTRNPIIDIGLNITQPFVNMILVLVLVFIALATILRLAGYEIKKLLPTFVLVALLVNFAPVICGIIVDASNIVMNFFTKEITGGARLISQLKSLGDTLIGSVEWETFKATKQIELVLTLVVFVVINLALFLVLLLFAFIFMVRYLAIWILVILSPLAFACYVLPATKKFWNLWWSQFIQWSIIGITMGFFLYLADQFAALNPVLSAQGLGGALLPTLLPLAFLYLGFVFGLSTGAMGAPLVIGLTKKAGKWTGSKAWTGAKTWAEEKGRTREAAGKAVQAVEKVPGARVFIPKKVREYGAIRPAIDKAQEELKPYGDPEIARRAAVGAIYGEKAAAGLLLNVTRGNSNDWFQQHMIQYGVNPKDPNAVEKLHENEKYRTKMARLLQIARSGGYHNDILRGAPRLAEFAIDAGFDGYKDLAALPRKEARIAAKKRLFEEIRPQHINNWEEQDVADKENIEELMYRGEDVWQAVSRVKRGHMRPLEVMADSYKTEFLKPGVSEEKAWDNFEESYRKQGKNGFFDYLASGRGKRQGWTKEKIIGLATGKEITPSAPTTPGEAAGIIIKEKVGRGPRTEEEIAEKKKIREELEKEMRKRKPPRGRGGVGV